MISPAYKVYNCKDIIYNKYAGYWFDYCFDGRKFMAYSKSLRYVVNSEDFNDIEIIIPPIKEQYKIVNYLDKRIIEINNAIEKTKESINYYKTYKKAIISKVVTRGINNKKFQNISNEWIREIPSNWKLIKGKYIFTERTTKGNDIHLELLSPTQKYGVIPQSLYEELSTQRTVKLDIDKNLYECKTIHSGDFCISLRSFEGGIEYSEYEGVVSPAYKVFYPIVEICSDYFKYLLKDVGFISKIASYSDSLRDGKSISFSDFGNTILPIPPLQEQKEIAQFLKKKCTEIDNLIASKEKMIDELEKYKKSLIYEYVTGKKEVV